MKLGKKLSVGSLALAVSLGGLALGQPAFAGEGHHKAKTEQKSCSGKSCSGKTAKKDTKAKKDSKAEAKKGSEKSCSGKSCGGKSCG